MKKKDADRAYEIVEACRDKIIVLAEMFPLDQDDSFGKGVSLICQDMVDQLEDAAEITLDISQEIAAQE